MCVCVFYYCYFFRMEDIISFSELLCVVIKVSGDVRKQQQFSEYFFSIKIKRKKESFPQTFKSVDNTRLTEKKKPVKRNTAVSKSLNINKKEGNKTLNTPSEQLLSLGSEPKLMKFPSLKCVVYFFSYKPYAPVSLVSIT